MLELSQNNVVENIIRACSLKGLYFNLGNCGSKYFEHQARIFLRRLVVNNHRSIIRDLPIFDLGGVKIKSFESLSEAQRHETLQMFNLRKYDQLLIAEILKACEKDDLFTKTFRKPENKELIDSYKDVSLFHKNLFCFV
jgi:hypothetical protein